MNLTNIGTIIAGIGLMGGFILSVITISIGFVSDSISINYHILSLALVLDIVVIVAGIGLAGVFADKNKEVKKK